MATDHDLDFRLFESNRRPHFTFGSVVSLIIHLLLIGVPLLLSRPILEALEEAEQRVTFLLPPLRPTGTGAAREQVEWTRPDPAGDAAGTATTQSAPPGTGALLAGVADTTPSAEAAEVAELPGPTVLTQFEVDSAVERDPASAGPEYPPALLARNIEGSAFVSYVVDSAGRVDVRSYRVIRATHPAFAAAVRAALPNMRFRPAVLSGQRVPQLVQQSFAFKIQPPTPDTTPPPRPAPR